MTETPLQSITNSGTRILILAPRYSMKIMIGRTVMTTYVIPFVIGILLARDSIVGIFIPSSISLPASLFTRSAIHHLMTNSLIICLQAYDVHYREGLEIPLRYSEWQILISIYANSTNTFGDTCRASLWSPSYIVTFDSTQGCNAPRPTIQRTSIFSWPPCVFICACSVYFCIASCHYAIMSFNF